MVLEIQILPLIGLKLVSDPATVAAVLKTKHAITARPDHKKKNK